MKDGIGDRGGWLVGIDIGGTFTDVVAIQPDDAEVRAAKVPSQRDTPVAAIAAGLEAVGIDPADIDNLVHGTTRVTNAIVEEKLPPVALVSTEGFEDTLAIARLRRRDLYRLDIPPRRAPLVSADRSFGLRERVEHSGAVHTPLEHDDLEALVQLLGSSVSRSIHEGLLAESLVYSTLQSGPEFASWLATRRPASPRESLAPAVLVEREGSQLKLRLNRSEKHNAFSKAIRDGLVEALRVVLSDDTIREVELSGQGPSFCSGGDLDEFGSFPDPATAHAIRSTRNPARLLAECAERVQVRVHGACIGAGAELPAFTARVEAAPDAFFALPELRMGLVPGAGGTVSLPRRIGRQRCGWLALSGQRIDSATALEWGLVDSIRPD